MDHPEDMATRSSIIRLGEWLVTPANLPDDLYEHNRARALLTILLSGTTLSSSILLMRLLNNDPDPTVIVGTVAGGILYVLGRFWLYKPVIWLTMIFSAILPYLMVFFFGIEPQQSLFVIAGSSTLLLSITLLSLERAGQFSLALLLVYFIYNLSIVDVSLVTSIARVGVMALFSIIVFLVSYITTRNRHALQATADQLTSEKTRLQSLLDASPELILVQQNKTIVYANKRALHKLGVDTIADLQSVYLDQLMTSQPKEIMASTTNLFSLTLRYDTVINPVQGKPFPVNVTATPIQYNERLATLMTMRTRSSTYDLPEKILQTVVDHTQDAILITDTDLENGPRIIYVNEAMCAMTGYSKAELLGKTPRILQGPLTDGSVLRKLREALAANQSFKASTYNYRKSGEAYLVEWVIHPAYDDYGKLLAYVSAQRDVTAIQQTADQLAERSNEYATLSNLMTDYAYSLVVDAEGQTGFEWIIGAYERMIGYSHSELMQMGRWEPIIDASDRREYQHFLQTVLAGSASTLEYRIHHADGEPHWVRDHAQPEPMRDGMHGMRIRGVVHEITQQRYAETALKSHIVQQAVVAELGLLALTYDDQQDLLDHAVVLTEQVLQVSACDIFAYVPETASLKLVAQSGLHLPAATMQSLSLEADSSQAAYTFQLGEPVISENIKQETRFRAWPVLVDNQITTSMSVLIHGHGRNYGVLSTHSADERTFTEDDIYFLQALANVMGTFIERYRAQQAEREQREFADALHHATVVIHSRLDLPAVLSKILEFVGQVITVEHNSSILLTDDQETFRMAGMRGERPPEINLAINSGFHLDQLPLFRSYILQGQPLFVPDVSQEPDWCPLNAKETIQSYVGVPIMIHDTCIGVINLHSTMKNTFTQADAERLSAFALVAGNAIENARLKENLERTVAERTAALQQEQTQLATILEATAEGIYYSDETGIRYVNKGFTKMTGYSNDDLRGKPPRILRPDNADDKYIAVVMDMIETVNDSKTWRGNLMIRRKDGTVFDAGVTASPVHRATDGMIERVTVIRDISKEIQLEAHKKRFISNASHELRTPITTLNTRLFLMEKTPEEYERHLEMLERISMTLNRMVDDLLNISYFETGQIPVKKTSFVLQKLLGYLIDITRIEAEKKAQSLHSYMPDEPIALLGDPARLEQVFMNLLSNAINYTPEEGTIWLDIDLAADHSEVYIRVRDTGQGIPAEKLSEIFQPFFRVDHETKHMGMGLGLSITRDLIERHGGRISVESEVNVGTTFTVTLPVQGVES